MYINLQRAFESERFLNRKINTLIPIGVDFKWNYIFEDFKNFKSLIIAGATGSGKSNFANCVILSLLKQKEPVSLILCDCKRVEFSPYKVIPGIDVFTKLEDIMEQLESLNLELKIRSTKKSQNEDFNKYFPKIFLIIDEYSDMVAVYENSFYNIAKNMAKNGPDVNIFLMMYTSRPSPTSVMNKELRDSFFTKIGFCTATPDDSITIIEEIGAEKLLGKGDMLFKKGDEPINRLQGFYVSDKEIEKTIKFEKDIKNNIKIEKLNNNFNINSSKEEIRSTLFNNDIDVEIQEVNIGPVITQFVLKLKKDTDYSKIVTLSDLLCMNLQAHPLRVTSISKSLIGIEIPNDKISK